MERKRGTEEKFSLVTVTSDLGKILKVGETMKNLRVIFTAFFGADRLNGCLLMIRGNSIWYMACILFSVGRKIGQ